MNKAYPNLENLLKAMLIEELLEMKFHIEMIFPEDYPLSPQTVKSFSEIPHPMSLEIISVLIS